MKGMQEHLFDKRVIRRNLESGLVKKADFEAYVADLPDMEDNISPVETEQPHAGGDGTSASLED